MNESVKRRHCEADQPRVSIRHPLFLQVSNLCRSQVDFSNNHPHLKSLLNDFQHLQIAYLGLAV